MRWKLIHEEEIENDYLSNDDNKLFEQYDKIIIKLNEKESNQLVAWSHQNLEYINVRKKNHIEDWQPCCSFLDESSDDFSNFKDDIDNEIKLFLSL